MTRQPYVLVAPENSRIRTLMDLASEGHRRPGQLRFISSGVGTGTHLSVEQLNLAMNVPELLTWFAEHDAEPMNLTQPEFAEFLERERDLAASIARAAGIAKA